MLWKPAAKTGPPTRSSSWNKTATSISVVALTGDEEGGKSNGVDWLLRNHRDLVDAEFALNADSGGVTSVNGKPVDLDIEASEKLYADFQLTATNPGGHSSLPVPDNAI